jgi:chemotaxis protein MotB
MTTRRRSAYRPNHDRWLVSYADFITLLFALFVVLFAASTADQKKAGKVAEAVKGAFQGLGVFSGGGKVVPLQDGASSLASNGILGDGSSVLDGAGTMNDVLVQLKENLKSSIDNGSIRLSSDSRGLTVSLTEAGFFDPGSAAVQPEAYAIVDKIAATLLDVRFDIRVEGHTDNTPIHTALFPSNWELSTARATNILQYLISNSGISPHRLSAVGYGEYHPAAPNTTAAGRAINRRVDLVILGASAQKAEPAEDE